MADRCENINAWKGEKTKRGEQRAFQWCKCPWTQDDVGS